MNQTLLLLQLYNAEFKQTFARAQVDLFLQRQ